MSTRRLRSAGARSAKRSASVRAPATTDRSGSGNRICPPPVPPRASSESRGSYSRATAGRSPDRKRARSAEVPASVERKRTPRSHCARGLGQMRRAAEVITASVPSLPTRSWTRSGPALGPEAVLSTSPVPSTASSESTMSSIFP